MTIDSNALKDAHTSVVKTNGQANYTFTHPKIFLRPSDLNLANHLQPILAAAGIIGVDVDFKEAGIRTIRIICEELVLLNGQYFLANNKNVEITCQKLSYRSDDNPATDKRILFDLSVPENQAPPPQEAPQRNQVIANPEELDCTWPGFHCTEYLALWGFLPVHDKVWKYHLTYDGADADYAICPARNAQPLGVANAGKQGPKGGSFTLNTGFIDSAFLDPKTPQKLHIRSVGGRGGRGQKGGNGVRGGSGFGFQIPADGGPFSFTADKILMLRMAAMIEGCGGSEGGYGGPGGQGGDGGDVTIVYNNDTVSTKDLSERFVSTDLATGPQGDIGENGLMGEKGAYGTSNVYWKSDFWRERAKEDAEEGSYEYRQYMAIADDDMSKYPRCRDLRFMSLDNEGLRQKTPEHARQPLAKVGALKFSRQSD